LFNVVNESELIMCHVFLYAGWSFRDGTSLILSDEIGQIFIIGTGQGESQKDARYDQVH
jgi:PH-interacting protein